MHQGLIAPVSTPFNADLSIATDLFVEHSRDLIEKGCVGLAPFGTTSEALSVGIEERLEALEALVKAGIPAEQIIPGTGLTNVQDTAILTRHAIDLGCDGAMILPPFYFKGISDDGLFQYFEQLILEVDRPELRIYLYHIPKMTAVGFSIDLVKRLRSAFPNNIVGIKDSSGDWDNLCALMKVDGLIVYPGTEMRVLEAMSLGAMGCISATANVNALAISQTINVAQGNADGDAEKMHADVRVIRSIMQSYDLIQAQKVVLHAMTKKATWKNIRPPLLEMDSKSQENLLSEIRNTGLLPI